MKDVFGPKQRSRTIRAGDGDPVHAELNKHTELSDDENVVTVVNVRYDKDFFYIAPFYHRIFPLLEKLIVLDLDLEFR